MTHENLRPQRVARQDHRHQEGRDHRACSRIDVNGTIVTASITNEAVDDLGLKVGDKVHAVIKASDVMMAIP
jgi:molybdopterin-binding protein